MEQKSLSLYLKTAGITGAAKFIKIFASFANLWLLNAILIKSDFGTLMIAVTLYFFISAVITTGFRSLVLYRISPMDTNDNDAAKMGGNLLTFGFITTCIISGLLVLSSGYIANMFGAPDLAFWIIALAAYLPFDLAVQVLCFYHRARQSPILSVIFIDLTQPIIRFILLGITFLIGFGTTGIIAAYLMEVALSFIVLFIIKPIPIKLFHSALNKSDFLYGLKMSGTQLLQQPTRSLDILMVGALAGTLAAADYTLAARLVTVMLLGQQLIDPLITPRLGKFFKNKDWVSLKTEYAFTKYMCFIVALCGMVFFSLFGLQIMNFFGEYDAAYPLFLILCASIMIRTGTGKSGEFLYMAGYAGTALLCVASAAFVMVIGGYILINMYGAYGAAWALLASVLILNVSVNIANWKITGFATTTIKDAAFITLASALCLLGAYEIVENYILATGFIVIGIAYSAANKDALKTLAKFRPVR